MLIFEGPEKRSSWGFHGVEGFSVGPAEKNYRCYTGWVPTTGAERISDTVVFICGADTEAFHPMEAPR